MCFQCEKKRTIVICDLCSEPFTFWMNRRPTFHTYPEYLHALQAHLVVDHGYAPRQTKQIKKVPGGAKGSHDQYAVPSREFDGKWERVATEWLPNPDYEPGDELMRGRTKSP